jgi:hypothetical protein
VDLSEVERIDSRGVGALVRSLTTAQRFSGSVKLVGPTDLIKSLLSAGRLDEAFQVYPSVEAAWARSWNWRTAWILGCGFATVVAFIVAGLLIGPVRAPEYLISNTGQAGVISDRVWRLGLELTKLAGAAAIGVLVTLVHRNGVGERPQTQPMESMEQAQILLCVAGALMMIIIGSDLARAFGIAGAASIIRFRTPIEDPKEIALLFLLMGLGMLAGLGAFAVAGAGTLFLCGFLYWLDRTGVRPVRAMMVEIESVGMTFPTAHVQRVFARRHVRFEPREVSHGKTAIIRYYATLDVNASLDALSEELIGGGETGIKTVAWSPPRRAE